MSAAILRMYSVVCASLDGSMRANVDDLYVSNSQTAIRAAGTTIVPARGFDALGISMVSSELECGEACQDVSLALRLHKRMHGLCTCIRPEGILFHYSVNSRTQSTK
jgi:hypothetical protein